MVGSSLEAILTPQFKREHPPLEPIDTYGPRNLEFRDVEQPKEVDDRITERLRALGYMD